MPLYQYKHPETDERIEVFQKMKEPHVYVDEEGTQWKRVWFSPNVTKDIKPIDPYSAKDFIKATDKKGTVADMWDLSAELSEKREKQEGEDPIKREYFNKYEKEVGVKHMADKPKVVENKNFKIDFTKSED